MDKCNLIINEIMGKTQEYPDVQEWCDELRDLFLEQQKQVDELQKQKQLLIDALYLKSDAIHFNEVMQSLNGGEQ